MNIFKKKLGLEQQLACGVMLGAAFGDSVGASVEFLTHEQIASIYGSEGVSEPLGFPGQGPGSITDDTQQALAVCRGIVHGVRRGGETAQILEDVYAELRQWRALQASMQYSRSPGQTSLKALESEVRGTIEGPLNQSDSCGAVMRAHPVGIYCAGSPSHALDLGAQIGALTHGSPDGYAPSGVLAAIIARIFKGDSVRSSVILAQSLLAAFIPEARRTRELIETVLGLDPSSDIGPDLGCGALGWTGPEALAIGIWSAIRFGHDLVKACSFAANHDGDSDSTASIAGAIVGSRLGISAVPDKWRNGLEHSGELRQRALELIALAGC